MVVKRLSRAISKFISRSCKCKTKYSLIGTWHRRLFYKIFRKVKVEIYKCTFCDNHVGGVYKNTIKKSNRYSSGTASLLVNKG